MFLVCGEAVIDFFQDSGGDLAFRGQPAGSPFNVCVGLARLGQRAALVTGLSKDAFGARLIAAMEREGVEWRLAPRTDRPTILSFILVKPDGGPEYAFYGERGADTAVTAEDLAGPLPEAVTAIHVGGFPMAVEPAKTAYATLIRREAGKRFVSLDPNVRASLTGDMQAFVAHFEGLCPAADLIKASTEDLTHMYPGAEPGTIAARWRDLGVGTVVITDGPTARRPSVARAAPMRRRRRLPSSIRSALATASCPPCWRASPSAAFSVAARSRRAGDPPRPDGPRQHRGRHHVRAPRFRPADERGARRPMKAKPRLLFVVTEDWFFCSHFKPMARAALAEGFDVAVACRVRLHGDEIRSLGCRLLPLEADRKTFNPLAIVRTLRAMQRLIEQETRTSSI